MAIENNSFARLLERFESRALYTKQKGSLFEHALKVYLKNEPKYRDDLENVWLWDEWREAAGSDDFDPRQDYGVDLVAKRKTGETIAIQAKFYGKGASLPRSRLESFVSRLGTKEFDEGILVATVPITSAASDLLSELSKPVHTITFHDLERSQVNWDEFFQNDRIELKARQQLHDYQEAAVKDVLKGFKAADRGKLIMACGSAAAWPFTTAGPESNRASEGRHYRAPAVRDVFVLAFEVAKRFAWAQCVKSAEPPHTRGRGQ